MILKDITVIIFKKYKNNTNKRKIKNMPRKNKNGEIVFKDYPEFRPNLTPKEIPVKVFLKFISR